MENNSILNDEINVMPAVAPVDSSGCFIHKVVETCEKQQAMEKKVSTPFWWMAKFVHPNRQTEWKAAVRKEFPELANQYIVDWPKLREQTMKKILNSIELGEP